MTDKLPVEIDSKSDLKREALSVTREHFYGMDLSEYPSSEIADDVADMMVEFAESQLTQVREELRQERSIKEAEKKILITEIERSTCLRRDLAAERFAHEHIGGLLLPLVGTPDGTSVGAASKAVGEITRLRSELEQVKSKPRHTSWPQIKAETIEKMEDQAQELILKLGKAEAENKQLEAMIKNLHCGRTGNVCGTDTWRVGDSCPCETCQLYLAAL